MARGSDRAMWSGGVPRRALPATNGDQDCGSPGDGSDTPSWCRRHEL